MHHIPNLLSLIRLVIAPFLFLAIKTDDLLLIIILSAAALLSDYLDGHLARYYHSISSAGKILDPIADKFCVAAAGLALSLYGDLPLSLLIIIVARDFGIVILGLVVMRKRKFIPVSNKPGKVTVLILALVLLVYVFKLTAVYDYAFAMALIFIVLSSIIYLYQGYRSFLNPDLNKNAE